MLTLQGLIFHIIYVYFHKDIQPLIQLLAFY